MSKNALELAILGSLKDRSLHGYELRKELKGRLGLFPNLSFGSLYPALKRMEQEGLISALATPSGAPGRAAGAFVPLTGSLSGERAAASSGFSALKAIPRHARNVYSLTQKGEQRFLELMQSPILQDDDQIFRLRLAFASHLQDGQRMELLLKRRESLQRALSELQATGQAPGTRLDRYSRALRQHRLTTLSMEIQWTQELIDNEKEESSWARSV
jgi:DNA-binding PadR family transcriptional regulator